MAYFTKKDYSKKINLLDTLLFQLLHVKGPFKFVVYASFNKIHTVVEKEAFGEAWKYWLPATLFACF